MDTRLTLVVLGIIVAIFGLEILIRRYRQARARRIIRDIAIWAVSFKSSAERAAEATRLLEIGFTELTRRINEMTPDERGLWIIDDAVDGEGGVADAQ